MKTRAQICKHKHFHIGCLKTAITFCKWKNNNFLFFFNSGRALVNRAGRKPVRAGCSALRNMLSWNTAGLTPVGMWSTFLRCSHLLAGDRLVGRDHPGAGRPWPCRYPLASHREVPQQRQASQEPHLRPQQVWPRTNLGDGEICFCFSNKKWYRVECDYTRSSNNNNNKRWASLLEKVTVIPCPVTPLKKVTEVSVTSLVRYFYKIWSHKQPIACGNTNRN